MDTKNETNSVQFIKLKEKTVWRYYDYATDCFKRFFETPAKDDCKILMQTKNFVIIGQYAAGDLDVFVWNNGVLEYLERDFHYFDTFLQTYDNEDKLYRIGCTNPDICSCLLIWGEDLYIVKSLTEVDNDGNWEAELTNGHVLSISETRDYPERGGYDITALYVSRKAE